MPCQHSQLRAFVEQLCVGVVDEVDAKAVGSKNIPSDGLVVKVQQESHDVVTGEGLFHNEFCTDDWRCDIRDSNVPFVLAVAEADHHVTWTVAGDDHTVSHLEWS